MNARSITPTLVVFAALLASAPGGISAATIPPKVIQTTGVRFPIELDLTAISSGQADLMLVENFH